MSLAEFLTFLSLAIKVIEGLVPASHQEIRCFVFTSDGAPFHAPDSSWKLYLVLHYIWITFSSKFLCLKDIVPMIVPKAKV